MEKIDRIFYRKINPSDFKKLYDIDKPATGGGQTYLEAAGISNESLVDFLSIAEKKIVLTIQGIHIRPKRILWAI